jgi:3-carboxy-cis,cis-muconate cycloisomerase
LPSPERAATALDLGLLAPGRAGSRVEAETGDGAYLQALLDAEAALARAQSSINVVPGQAAEAITSAALAENFDLRQIALDARSGGNPVIPLVNALRAQLPEDVSPYVHRGATSQDILDTATMLVADRTRAIILTDLDRISSALAVLAARHRTTPMPGRTLTQHAVPTTFGLKVVGWRSLVLDARDRLTALTFPAQLAGAAGTLAALIPESNPAAVTSLAELAGAAGTVAAPVPEDDPAPLTSPAQLAGPAGTPAAPVTESNPAALTSPAELAGAAGTLAAPVPENDPAAAVSPLIESFAAESGLAVPALPWHVLRTPVAELGGALALTSGALGKFAADVLVLGRTEIAEITQATGAAGGSSAMPHKANPVNATLIAATAQQVPALAGILYAAMAAEDERPAGAWHAEWQNLRQALRLVGTAAELAAELAEGLDARPEKMAENLTLTGGLIVSERLVGALEPLLGRAEARAVLSAASKAATANGSSLESELRVLIDADRLSPDELANLLDPSKYLGAAPDLVDRALERK